MAATRAVVGVPFAVYAVIAEDARGRLLIGIAAALAALVYLALSAWSARFETPYEAGTLRPVASRTATFVRGVAPDLVTTLLMPAAFIFVFPGYAWMVGVLGVFGCASAAGLLAQAASIDRWERRHSAYVVQSGYWAMKRSYIPTSL